MAEVVGELLRQKELLQKTTAENQIWTPLDGPQLEALNSDADETYYGGAAGGGKSDLLLGASITRHTRSIIYRRQFKQLEGLRERAEELLSEIGRWNGQKELWRFNYKGIAKRLEFGAVQLIGDERKYQGRPHDLKNFDEIPHFAKSQYDFLKGWNRTSDPLQRCRVIAAGNPPMDAEGDWVIPYWGPWLDPATTDPAKNGELRWYAMIDGKDTPVDGPKPIHIPGEADLVQPKSRTFIRARVQDNPFYMTSGYLATLQALPEPLRSRMLFGNFEAGHEDHEFQVIPTEWVLRAQGRWRPDGALSAWMDALGVDVARGGQDKTVLTPRYGTWFGPQLVYPGISTPDSWAVLQLIVQALSGQRAAILIDGIGVGAAVYDLALGSNLDAYALIGSERSNERDKSGQLGFYNKRAAWIWKLREALDPLTGDDLAIPPDRELMADLTAPRWEMTVRGIKIELKDDIIERIGRSPDKGESLIYAHAQPESPPRTHLL